MGVMKKRKFKQDQTSRLFFVSDTHFGHKKILKHENRPFETVEEMNENLIIAWNQVVPEDGYVVVVGDFCWNKKDQFKYLTKILHGEKIFVKGNHDNMPICKTWPDMLSVKVEDDDFEHDYQYIVCCHFPMSVWDKSHYGSWHVHGHIHSRPLSQKKHRYHVGVDVNPHYAPISYSALKEKINQQGE